MIIVEKILQATHQPPIDILSRNLEDFLQRFCGMKALSLCLLYAALTAVAVVPLVSADARHPAEDAGIKSGMSGVKTKITFVNDSHTTIKVYWLNFEGARVLYHTLKPGEAVEQSTYLTHPWLITDEDDNAWQLYFPDAQSRKIEFKNPGEP